MTRRIAVTGLGAVSALGRDLETTWAAVLAGRTGIAIDPSGDNRTGETSRLPTARMVEGFEARIDQVLGRPFAAGLDRFAQAALAAGLEALDQAGLLGDPILVEDTAIVLGHGFGGVGALETAYERFFTMETPRIHPTTVPRIMASAGVSALSMALGVRGPVFATSSACASSAHAIAQGAGLILSGQADVAIVGGSEAICTPGSLASWEAIRAVSPTGCRPFSADRDGMVLGEGAGVLVLEDFERARARGASILGEFLAAGMSSDAGHITQPSPEGQARALRRALNNGHMSTGRDLLVSTHGTGTVLNDVAETRALHEVLGAAVQDSPVIATKASVGHLIGGAASLQAALGLRALAARQAPPIANFGERDPACDLDLVVGSARNLDAGFLLQNAFAFGGLNVSLAFAGPAAV